MKHLKLFAAIVIISASTANAEVIERDYYLKDGVRVYTDEDTSKAATLEQSFEPASGIDVQPVIIKRGEYVLYEDIGGDYVASQDVYEPKLGLE